MKTLLVGWDAACWEYLQPLLDADRLPVLSGLISSGVSGSLRSTMPPWTPTAWATLITGRDPDGHGVFDMLRRTQTGGQLQPINASSRTGEPFWKHLNRSGIRTGLVNVPFIYPLEPLDGFAVCGFGTPNTATDIAYPESAAALLAADYPDFLPEVDAKLLGSGQADEIFKAERRQQARFVEIAVKLADRIPVDLLVINLMFPDHANHKMPDMDRVRQAYEHTDTDLARLIDAFRPDSIVLISDHGSNRSKGDFWLGAWLRDAGYLIETSSTQAMQADRINWFLTDRDREGRGRGGPVERGVRRLRKEALLRASGWLEALLWDRIERDFPRLRESIRLSGKPDIRRSLVIPGSAYAGLLYLNREALAGWDAAETAQELRESLLRITTPDSGEPLFSNIYLGEELSSGRAAGRAPDLILDAYDSGWIIRTARYTSHPGRPEEGYFYSRASNRDFGWHTRDGIYIFNGMPFCRIAPAGHAHIADIPATLLHTLGLPVPGEYDGRVLLDTLSDALLSAPVQLLPVVTDAEEPAQVEFSEADAEKLIQQLKALGYLD